MTDEEPEEAQALLPSRGPDRDEMAADYLPEQHDWLAKTKLDITDPHAIAALSQFETMFPEVDDVQPMIDEFIDDFLRGRTSVNAESRDEYKDIIQSMFGSHGDEEGASSVRVALGAEEE